MSVYSNQFWVETGPEVVRIVFNDEHSSASPVLPNSLKVVAEVVVTRENAKALADVLLKGLGLPKV